MAGAHVGARLEVRFSPELDQRAPIAQDERCHLRLKKRPSASADATQDVSPDDTSKAAGSPPLKLIIADT